MNSYTGPEIAKILQEEGYEEASLRNIRYYKDVGLAPPLEQVGNKMMYTEKHLDYFRAAFTLKKTGESLEEIKATLQSSTLDAVSNYASQSILYRKSTVVDNDTRHFDSSNVIVSFSPQVSAEVKEKIVDFIDKTLKGESTDVNS